VTIDPDKPCPHEDFHVFAEVDRISREDGGPVIAFALTVRVDCVQCGEKFRFTGLQAGLRPDRPTVSPGEDELRAPMRPASADPDFGLGIPGFAVRWREANEFGTCRVCGVPVRTNEDLCGEHAGMV
jgi:hypothetical protein